MQALAIGLIIVYTIGQAFCIAVAYKEITNHGKKE